MSNDIIQHNGANVKYQVAYKTIAKDERLYFYTQFPQKKVQKQKYY